jgi:SNF2 family DNA or RNA helicase
MAGSVLVALRDMRRTPTPRGVLSLYAHQVRGIEWLRTRPRALLADEPGLGKSLQLLAVAKEPVLIVAPAMVLDSGVWDDELAKWAPGLDATQVPYSSLSLREKTAKGGTTPVGQLKPEFRRQWGTVIADEAHYLKGRKTSWTQAFKQLRTEQLHQATGTPIPNWAHEAFQLLQLLRPDDPELRSYWRWVGQWFEKAPTHWNPWNIGGLREGVTWEQFREANWQEQLLLRKRDECLDLPPLTRQQWRVKMPPAQAKAYRELKRDFITWLEQRGVGVGGRGEAGRGSGGTGQVEVVAWNNAAQLVKLCQAATGLEVLDEEAKGSGKLEALAAILEDRPRPTLVVAHFRASVREAAKVGVRLGKRTEVIDGGTSSKERGRIVRLFQAGNIDVLCATLDTISEGVTLVSADQIVFLERSWRPSRNEQATRRIHRIGQERPVTVIDLVTANTVDQRILSRLATKTDQQIRALGTAELRELI